MHRRIALATLAVICLHPAASHAQDKTTRRAEKKLAEILADFNEDLRGYEKGLKHFEKVPDAEPLLAVRRDLVEQAAEMGRLEKAGRGSGPAVLKLAKEMDLAARKLDSGTAALEKHARNVARKGDRDVAAQMRTYADSITKATDRMIDMFR